MYQLLPIVWPTSVLSSIVCNNEISFSAPHHFNSEAFIEGRALITQGVGVIKANVKKENFQAARETLGRVLHTLQVRTSQQRKWVKPD